MPDLHNWEEMEGDNLLDSLDGASEPPAIPTTAGMPRRIKEETAKGASLREEFRRLFGRGNNEDGKATKPWLSEDNPAIWDGEGEYDGVS